MTGAGLTGSVAGIQAGFTVELRNQYNVPQPVGFDLDDNVTVFFTLQTNNATVHAKTQGLCCDDDLAINGLTGGFFPNCTDAFSHVPSPSSYFVCKSNHEHVIASLSDSST